MFRPHRDLSPLEYHQRLERAAAGTDAFPHMPAYDAECCEYCNRPDWEAVGNCLARVRNDRGRLRAVAKSLGDLESRLCPPKNQRDMDTLWTIRGALSLLNAMGVE